MWRKYSAVRENTKIQLYYLGGHAVFWAHKPKGCEITYPELGKYLPQLKLSPQAVPCGVSLTCARHVCVPIFKDDWQRVPVPIDVQAFRRQRGHAGEIIRITNFCRNLCVALDPGSKVQNKLSGWVVTVLFLHYSWKPRYAGRGQSMCLKGEGTGIVWWGVPSTLKVFHLSVRNTYNLHSPFLKNLSVFVIISDPTATGSC